MKAGKAEKCKNFVYLSKIVIGFTKTEVRS